MVAYIHPSLLSDINQFYRKRGFKRDRVYGAYWNCLEQHHNTSSQYKKKRNLCWMKGILAEMVVLSHRPPS